MEEYKSILKLIDETLKNNSELLEHYRKASVVYEEKIRELQQKLEASEAEKESLMQENICLADEIKRQNKVIDDFGGKTK